MVVKSYWKVLIKGIVVAVYLLSHVHIFCDPMDCSPPGPLSMGFSRQEYWSGLSFPSPGDLPHPRIKPASPALVVGVFTTKALRKKLKKLYTPNSDLEISFECGMKSGLRESVEIVKQGDQL